MGHKSWGGARPNKWDRQFHEESQPGAFFVRYNSLDKRWHVIDSRTDESAYDDMSIIKCELECEHLNSLEQA